MRDQSRRSHVVHLGLNVFEQQVDTVHLQQHVLTPHTTHAVQQLQTLHAVSYAPQLLAVQLTGEQMLQGQLHKINPNKAQHVTHGMIQNGSRLCG